MAKSLLQDMKVKKSSSQPKKMVEKRREEIKVSNSNGIKHPRKKSKFGIYFTAFISIIFLLFALSYLFSGTKIIVTPKIQNPELNDKLSATKDSKTSGLSFDLVVISGNESKTIQGGEEKDVSVPAKGTVLIYNTYSASPQTLSIDTRLEGSNGKIYKTTKQISVPGMTSDGKPGVIEVEIYGTEAGEEYNSVPLDFKILGFKGTSKYSKFYGRSKGDITGGFIGKSVVVSSLDKLTTASELKSKLETKLLNKITEQIPNGFVLFKDAIFLDINENNVSFTPDQNGMVSANIKGQLFGFLFNEEKLAKKIAQDVVEGYDDSSVYIPNIKDLVFSLEDKENISFADVKNINFSLSGKPEIIWKVDESNLANDILNQKKSDFNQILSKYPNIDSAELTLRPFWKKTFPEKIENIEVIVNYPKQKVLNLLF